jgi:glycosyltransferase involved in cell wall biosynthesis
LAVSSYTKQQITNLHKIASDKITVFHNTIDPYFPLPDTFNKNPDLLKRYGLNENDFILYTLCRLSSKEQYKGYDYVIKALPALLKKHPNIKYLVAGKYDDVELNRLKALISETGVSANVIFAGFLDDSELIAHYQLGDVYIMPSQREGFGIVFIEAMACGSRVIAGNKDGSVDALAKGELGKLVDPTSVEEITKAIEDYYLSSVNWNMQSSADLQKRVIKHFGFSIYKDTLKQVIPTL